MERDTKDSAGRCSQLEKEFSWIAGEKQLFGNPRSDYNWTVRDPAQVDEEYRGLEEKLKTLTRGLNKRVSRIAVHAASNDAAVKSLTCMWTGIRRKCMRYIAALRRS